MFLAINELLKEKSRYLLILAVISLVSYLTFFLTALAYGLATSYTQGIEKWQADEIVLQRDANGNVARSLLLESEYGAFIGENTALLGVSSATVEAGAKEDVAIFGIELDGFLRPVVTSGRDIEAAGEIVVSDALEESGVELGQSIMFKGVEAEYKVVGFTDRATFQTAPILYMRLDEWRSVASGLVGMNSMRDETTVNAVVVRGELDLRVYENEELQVLAIEDYFFKLPGYGPQVLTFGLMIGFLIVIASFVLAIFMYILTLQKKSIFGVLKAEGVPNSYIGRSVRIQTLLLTGIGVAIGFILAVLSGFFLAGTVPFIVQPIFFAAIVGLFLAFSIIGGMASVWVVTKIDPVEAIG